MCQISAGSFMQKVVETEKNEPYRSPTTSLLYFSGNAVKVAGEKVSF